MEYTRINSWLQLGTGLRKAEAMHAEGWELITVASMNFLGSTFAYQLIFRRAGR
ncbi:MAG: hypothetical protein ACI9KE_003111 [Polyangiales bacterium]|jgi:hypothetical protein